MFISVNEDTSNSKTLNKVEILLTKVTRTIQDFLSLSFKYIITKFIVGNLYNIL